MGHSKTLKTCPCFPICLPWLRMFNKVLYRHRCRWRWLTGKRLLPPRLMAWIWFLWPTWQKERVNSPRFYSQTTTCVLWHVNTYTYFTHIKIPTGTLPQKAAVLRAIGLGNQSEEHWPMRTGLSCFFPTNFSLCRMSDWVLSKSPRAALRRCSTNLRYIHITSREHSLTLLWKGCWQAALPLKMAQKNPWLLVVSARKGFSQILELPGRVPGRRLLKPGQPLMM